MIGFGLLLELHSECDDYYTKPGNMKYPLRAMAFAIVIYGALTLLSCISAVAGMIVVRELFH